MIRLATNTDENAAVVKTTKKRASKPKANIVINDFTDKTCNGKIAVINNKSYIEKVICKSCGSITYRNLEIREIPINTTLDKQDPVYAFLVEEFSCPNCKKENSFTSTLVEASNKELNAKKVALG